MERIIVDSEEVIVEEQVESETQAFEPHVTGGTKPKWSLKKKLLVFGGAVAGLALAAVAVFSKSKTTTDDLIESFEEDNGGDESSEIEDLIEMESESTNSTDF